MATINLKYAKTKYDLNHEKNIEDIDLEILYNILKENSQSEYTIKDWYFQDLKNLYFKVFDYGEKNNVSPIITAKNYAGLYNIKLKDIYFSIDYQIKKEIKIVVKIIEPPAEYISAEKL